MHVPRLVRAALLAVCAPFAAAAAEIGYLHVDATTRIAVTTSGPEAPRVIALDAPPRLVIDVAGPPPQPPPPPPGGLIAAARAGLAAEGRGRIALDLARPARLAEAELARLADGRLQLRLRLEPAETTRAPAAWPAGAAPQRAFPPAAAPREDPRPVVVIDPGHGGIDPGALRGDLREADVVLAFALDLAAALEADGRWRPVLTRDDDRYLGLRERVARAEAAGANAFLSIHANTVIRGAAAGASVFTLSDLGSDAEAEALAAQENRADLLGGADLAGDADDVTRALIELSQRRSLAASRRLGAHLAQALSRVSPMLPGRAHAQAAFRVLKSPLTASALIELGFLTDDDDAARMTDPGWRARAAREIARGLDDWLAATAPDAPRRAARGDGGAAGALAPPPSDR